MPDIDRIIERLLGDRRMSESATFSSRTYTDQPIIERGSDFKARMERKANERAERRQRDARARREARSRHEKAKAQRNATTGNQRQIDLGQTAQQPPKRQGFADWLLSIDRDIEAAARRSAHVFEPLPEPIREMRKLEGVGMPQSIAYGSNAMSSLFYRQALLMQNYEDDYEFHGGFSQYYPTYAAMSDTQLRGYFTWRTRVRAGQVGPAPLSFAFVYVYELIAGIGVTPGQEGLDALRAFGQAYQQTDERQGAQLNNYLRRWAEDYAIYHGLVASQGARDSDPLGSAALDLLRAEHALLSKAKRSPRIANEAAATGAPSPERLFQALGEASTYHICESRLAKDEPELVTSVTLDVFRELVLHCSKRRKTDYVEGLFGYASRTPYAMFSAAVFFEPTPHEDCVVRVSDCLSYVCERGRWHQLRACDARSRSSELGLALHAVDYTLREQLGYAYPLKQREMPKYLQKIVTDAVARRLEERAEAERRRITIDLSQLASIRAAAAITQEALLTDEERDEVPEVPAEPQPQLTIEIAGEEAATAAQAEGMQAIAEQPETTEQPEATATSAATAAAEGDGPLSPLETTFLLGILEQRPVSELVGPTDPFPSVIVDTINEKLFDLIGDAVIEFDGDQPSIVEDYLEDIREVLHI